MPDMAKMAYQPIGLAVSLASAAVAGRAVGLIWKKLADEDEIPTPWIRSTRWARCWLPH